MDSHFQVRDVEHTVWFASQEVRSIVDVVTMVTKALDAAGGEGEASIQAPTDHDGVSLRPISADHFSVRVRDLFYEPPGKFLVELNLRNDTFHCVSWVPREEHCVAVSEMTSRPLGIYGLTIVRRPARHLDLDRSCNEIWDHSHVSFVAPRVRRQLEWWDPQDKPETGRDTLYKRVADLVATYEGLFLVPDGACVTHYLGDLGIYIFKYDAVQEQIQNAYEKALSVMETDDTEFQAEKQLVYRGEIISAMWDHLLVGELKPEETILFAGTEPYDRPGNSELRGEVAETADPSKQIYSIRGELFTMHDVSLHYVLGRHGTSVGEEHYGSPHMWPLLRGNCNLTGQYPWEAEASWNAQQVEMQIDALQMMQGEASEMQKAEITLPFDDEKSDALEFYLKKESTTIQECMNETLTELYRWIIPEAVWEFLNREALPPVKPKRLTRPGVEKPSEKAPEPEGQTALERNGDPT